MVARGGADVTVLPDRSSTDAMAGALGPVTTISLTPLRSGGVRKSTMAWRDSVTVMLPPAMSPSPSATPEISLSRVVGMMTTVKRRLLWHRLLGGSWRGGV